MGSTYFTKRCIADFKKKVRGKKPKAFKSEEKANKYAKENGIKKFTLVNLRKKDQKPKIKILPE